MIALTINGRPVTLDGPTPLVAYLGGIAVDPRTVAVEVNGRILHRTEFESTTLEEGDAVEVVRMVGGG